VFLFAICLTGLGFAQPADDLSDIFEMPLEDLLNLKVTSPSKQAVRLTDAPAVISVWQQQTITALGLETLADLSDITPGYSSYTIFGERVFETRGQKAGSFNNNKHLLLVDGIPINHARAYKASAEEELPLFFADSVEMIRGPASALYGVSAFYGTVSITPQERKTNGSEIIARAGFGSNDNDTRAQATWLHRSPSGHSTVSGSWFQKDASAAQVGLADDPTHLFYDNRESAFAFASHEIDSGALRGVKAGVMYLHKKSGLGEHWDTFSHPQNELTWDILVLYAKYNRKVGSSGKVAGYVKHNTSTEIGHYAVDAAGSAFGDYDITVHNFEAQAEYHWQSDSFFDGIVGLNYDQRHEDSWVGLLPLVPMPGSAEFRTMSAFLQLQREFPVLAGLLLTLGARQDSGRAGDNEYDHLSPRLGLVQRLATGWTLKFLYGNALRSPGIKEIGLNDESMSTNPSLDLPSLVPETIDTIEAGLFHEHGPWLIGAAIFHNTTKDALDGTQVQGENVFVNANGTTISRGFELDLKYRKSAGLEAFFNTSFAHAEDREDMHIEDVPTWKANFGVMAVLPFLNDLGAGGVVRYVDGWQTADPDLPEPNGHVFVDLNFRLPVATHATAELLLRNLFDETAWYPRGGAPYVPMAGDRKSVV